MLSMFKYDVFSAMNFCYCLHYVVSMVVPLLIASVVVERQDTKLKRKKHSGALTVREIGL